MFRTSSPNWYSRTSLKVIPRPLKAEWYSPANMWLERPRVLISICRTFLISSVASKSFVFLMDDKNVILKQCCWVGVCLKYRWVFQQPPLMHFLTWNCRYITPNNTVSSLMKGRTKEWILSPLGLSQSSLRKGWVMTLSFLAFPLLSWRNHWYHYSILLRRILICSKANDHGTSTVFSISLMISSEVTLLASASYDKPMRWRMTSWHTARTSSGTT